MFMFLASDWHPIGVVKLVVGGVMVLPLSRRAAADRDSDRLAEWSSGSRHGQCQPTKQSRMLTPVRRMIR